jgi:hypothetical protein
MENSVTRTINDLQGLEIETFQIEELDGLGLDAAQDFALDSIDITLCSSTTSSSCG